MNTMAGNSSNVGMMELFPEIQPFDTGYVHVSDLHTLYFEQCGKKDGKPVIYFHGGPGSGTSERDRRFFDPEVYRIILLHQRGSGKSTPTAELKDNTTWHLVEDVERVREQLKIDKWVVFGGSWGSTLALSYAAKHPSKIKAIILRGIYLGSKREDNWFYTKHGAANLWPEYWEDFIKPIPNAERRSLIDAYYRRLTSDDPEVFLKYARAWNKWEMITGKLLPDMEAVNKCDTDEGWSLAHAKIECHYFLHGCFFDSDCWLLDQIDCMRHIPATIIQGRYDVTCPIANAWDLHKRWPEAEYHVVPDAGHSTKEPGVVHRLVEATEKYKLL